MNTMNSEEERKNIQPAINPAPQPVVVAPLSPADERTWAMLAHLSVLLNLVTGFLGVGAALLIYFIYKDRSRYVAYQAMQAFLFQLVFWAGGGLLIGAMWAIVGALSAILIGILLIPFAVVLTLLFLVNCNANHQNLESEELSISSAMFKVKRKLVVVSDVNPQPICYSWLSSASMKPQVINPRCSMWSWHS